MADQPFSAGTDKADAPSRNAFTITPHDTNELAACPKGIYVGTAGNIVGRTIDGTADVTLKNVPAGKILPIRFLYIRATNTTAADLVALA